MMSYSLWFMPSGSIFRELNSVISDLSSTYKSPSFLSHITLIGSINEDKKLIIEKTKMLSQKIKPFEIKLATIGYSGNYYKSLFINVIRSYPLRQAYLEAKSIFACENNETFKPHLSLFYGNLPKKEKEAITANLRDYQRLFSIDHIHLFSTQGAAKYWHKIMTFTLKSAVT